jgi:hypothetical protein
MFFLNNSIPSVFAQLNTDASILKELRENLDIEEIDVIYFHDRFDQEYEKAFQEYES